jgi:Flp pilus assembly protein TadG
MKRLVRTFADDRGGAAVEMALTITAFILLLLGGLDYGYYLWTANALQQTASRTARCMGVLQTNCSVARAYNASNTTAFAEQVGAGYGLALSASNITLTTATTCGGQGTNNAQVTISYTFPAMSAGLMPGVSGAMSAQACFPSQA